MIGLLCLPAVPAAANLGAQLEIRKSNRGLRVCFASVSSSTTTPLVSPRLPTHFPPPPAAASSSATAIRSCRSPLNARFHRLSARRWPRLAADPPADAALLISQGFANGGVAVPSCPSPSAATLLILIAELVLRSEDHCTPG
ncbi:unnamed protein product [Urochloa humidicola]